MGPGNGDTRAAWQIGQMTTWAKVVDKSFISGESKAHRLGTIMAAFGHIGLINE